MVPLRGLSGEGGCVVDRVHITVVWIIIVDVLVNVVMVRGNVGQNV